MSALSVKGLTALGEPLFATEHSDIDSDVSNECFEANMYLS